MQGAVKVTRKSTAAKLAPALAAIKLPERPSTVVKVLPKAGNRETVGVTQRPGMGATGLKLGVESSGPVAILPPAPAPGQTSDSNQFYTQLLNSLNDMAVPIQTVVNDDASQMRLALSFAVVLLALGVGVIAYSAYNGKLDQTLLGAVVAALFTAPYSRYDAARKEKNYYELLVPSMKVGLADCMGKPAEADQVSCCSTTLGAITTLINSLQKIAGSPLTTDSQSGGSANSGTGSGSQTGNGAGGGAAPNDAKKGQSQKTP